MMRLYSKTVFITLLFTFLCTGVRAQNTLASQSFEGAVTDDWAYTESPTTFDNADLWAVTTSVGSGGNAITDASEGSSFWGMLDLNNTNGGTSGELTLTFAPVTVTGNNNVMISFDYNEFGFDVGNGDYLEYEVLIDGTSGGRQSITTSSTSTMPTGWTTITEPAPDGTNTVQLILIAKQNGNGDWAGWDNAKVVFNNAADPCGITNFGPAATSCTSSTAGADNDTYEVSIPFSGSDADASLVVEVGGSAVGFTIAAGDLAAGTSPLVVQSPDFLEGTSFSIGLTDGGGDCATVTPVTGSVTANECNPSCDVSILTENVTFFCESLTDNIDNITIDIDYTGNDDGVNVTITGLINGEVFAGTDLFNDPDGRVSATGIPEGDTYTVVVSGSGCDRMFTLPIPDGICAGSDIVINEVLYDGLSNTDQTNLNVPAFEDPNRDNVFSGGEDEFVEITNIGSSTIDIGGYTLSDQNNADIITIPAGTMLAPGEYFVFFGGGAPDLPCATVTRASQSAGSAFLGLNNTGDEQVIIKDASGTTVAQMMYTGMGNVNESLALSPNADPTGSFVAQTSILDPIRYSPCFDNDDESLPVELVGFSARTYAKYVMLDWETVNEVANDRFTVERSANGRVWERIGTIMAAGTDAAVYKFKDDDPMAGQNIYRLRQYDLEGAFALYGPVMAEFNAAAGIYPNPVREELSLRGFGENARINLLDASGKLLRELPMGANQATVSNLRPGVYMLRIFGENGPEVLRFVKQ